MRAWVNTGGHVVGEDHHRAKLSDFEVEWIRRLREENVSYGVIAAKFDVSKSCVIAICQGKRRAETPMGTKELGEVVRGIGVTPTLLPSGALDGK